MAGRATIYLDCCAGITPALLLGALIDAGLTLDELRAELAVLPLDGWTITTVRRASQGIAGQGVALTTSAQLIDRAAAYRMLNACRIPLAQQWGQRALDALWFLQPQPVALLEDVLGVLAVTGGAMLLGIKQILAAPLPLAPAARTLRRLAEQCGVPTTVEEQAPNPDLAGMALLAGLAAFRRPALRLVRVGYGIGERSLDRPDLVRVLLGEAMETCMEPSDALTSRALPPRALIVVTATPHPLPISPELDALIAALRDRTGLPVFGGAASRGASDVTEMLRLAAATGARQLVVLPLLIGESHPSMSDIAGALRWAQATWPDRQIVCSALPLNADQVAGLLAQRAAEAIRMSEGSDADGAVALVVLGEGSHDRHANADVAQIARLLWERMPEHAVAYAFAANTRPILAQTIERCREQGAQRIVVLPLRLLPDGNSDHAAASIDAAAASDGPVLVAAPLLSAVGIAAILYQRAGEVSSPDQDRASRDPLSGTRWAVHQHSHVHPAAHQAPFESLLPPRYQGDATVSAAPMGAADLRYDADGQVAWDTLWSDFCDLALAGGPPHRGALLEPVTADAVHADPAGYARVITEIARGLRLVTGLEVLADQYPGWVGLRCHDEAMALWMLRAIVVENVSVRREGVVLFLPAGPAFQLAGEIKNVITVVAKTHHYWVEHRAALSGSLP